MPESPVSGIGIKHAEECMVIHEIEWYRGSVGSRLYNPFLRIRRRELFMSAVSEWRI